MSADAATIIAPEAMLIDTFRTLGDASQQCVLEVISIFYQDALDTQEKREEACMKAFNTLNPTQRNNINKLIEVYASITNDRDANDQSKADLLES